MHFRLNILLFDPVPGNLITCTKFCDLCACGFWYCRCFHGYNTANSSYDLSKSRILDNVLALYPCKPLPDCICHMPIFPKYPH